MRGFTKFSPGGFAFLVLALGVFAPGFQACGGSRQPESGSRSGSGSSENAVFERSIEVLQRSHLTRHPLDDEMSARLFRNVLRTLDPSQKCFDSRELEELSSYQYELDDALRRFDLSFIQLAASMCETPTISAAERRYLFLDALAGAYDPHSSYLSQGQLKAFRQQIHDVGHQPENDARGTVIERGQVRIGVIVLPAFYLRTGGRSTTEDIRYILKELSGRGARLVLLDLRRNAGGVVEQAVRLAGFFLGAGPVARVKNADGDIKTLGAEQPDRADPGARERGWRGPLIVLVDRRSASASEVFVAAVQDRGRGLVVGTRTQGKGTAQELNFLASPLGTQMGAVNVTSRQFYRLNGDSIQRRGVRPDVELSLSNTDLETIAREEDRPNALPFDRIDPVAPGLLQPIDSDLVNELQQRERRRVLRNSPSLPPGPHPEDEDPILSAALEVALDYLKLVGFRNLN